MPDFIATNDTELRRALDAFVADIESEFRAAQTASLSLFENEIKNQIQSVGAIASRDLLNSIQSRVQVNRGVVRGQVGSPEPQAEYVERGRRPGKQPPSDAILKWMAFKGLEPTASGAFLIARAIGRRGIAGRFPFQKAFDAIVPQSFALFDQAAQNIVRRYV